MGVITDGLKFRVYSSLYKLFYLLFILGSSSVYSITLDENRFFISGGQPVSKNDLDAVGTIPDCTATLISNDRVLTAAHCVCKGISPSVPEDCLKRSYFTLHDVYPTDNPKTRDNESLVKTDVHIWGDVKVHPRFMKDGWLSNDFAMLQLDQPVTSRAKHIKPLAISYPSEEPRIGEPLLLVGFGKTGLDCQGAPQGKRSITMPLYEITTYSKTFRIGKSGRGACPGDSGGPAINKKGHIVGVLSTSPGNYDPTSSAYSWLYKTGEVFSTKGIINYLRIHEVASGYGPVTDPINGEVVVKLEREPDIAFGFKLRKFQRESFSQDMLKVLREAFMENRTVTLTYIRTGPKHCQLLGVREHF